MASSCISERISTSSNFFYEEFDILFKLNIYRPDPIPSDYSLQKELRLAVISQPLGLGESGIRFSSSSKRFEDKTFAKPGVSIVWLQFNSIVK